MNKEMEDGHFEETFKYEFFEGSCNVVKHKLKYSEFVELFN